MKNLYIKPETEIIELEVNTVIACTIGTTPEETDCTGRSKKRDFFNND